MLKNKKIIISFLLVAIVLFGGGFAVGAATAEPGSNGDPLITKSYLDSQIQEFNKDSGFKKIAVSKGHTVSCTAGTQLIIVSGTMKANEALIDTTSGKKTAKSKALAKNHSLFATGNCNVKANKSSTVLILGDYTLK